MTQPSEPLIVDRDVLIPLAVAIYARGGATTLQDAILAAARELDDLLSPRTVLKGTVTSIQDNKIVSDHVTVNFHLNDNPLSRVRITRSYTTPV
jgi:hypothetical protein